MKKFLCDFIQGTLIAAGFLTMIGMAFLLFWQFIEAFNRLILNPSLLNLVIFLSLISVGGGLYVAFKLLEHGEEG